MSGAAGGSRINKEDLKATIRDYRDNILKPLGLDKSYSITGVRSRPEKNIFGDIDVVVSFSGGDKKELKQDLAKFLSQVDKIPPIPYKKNNKYFIHGNIVSTLYPIIGKEGEYVQIDNIVTTSKEEGKFVYNMLDLPAQEQTLAIGLAKAIFTELDEKQIERLFKELNIPTNERPGEDEEYDFNLNPSELSLRIVPIGKNDGREIWKSNKFEDVKKLTAALGVDIEKDKFDIIVSKVKKFKNRRSIDRLKGMFAKNIRVGDAEKGIEKGIKKQQAMDAVAALENKYSSLVMGLIKPFILEETIPIQTIALMPGAFKPPHRDHLRRINAAAKTADKAIILISPLDRAKEGETSISAKQSLAIWQLYKDKGVLAPNVEFKISPDNAPVKTAYDIASADPNNQYIGVYGKDDAVRWKNLPNEKYPNITASDFGIVADLSASDLRRALLNNNDITPWLPDGITPEEYKEALNIKSLNEYVPEPEIDDIDDYADDALSPLDLKIPSHFIDRVNDKRNRPEIEADELYDFFDKLSDEKDELEDMLDSGEEIVAVDSDTDINIPLAKDRYKPNTVVAKTIMRKKNFATSNPKLVFEKNVGDSIVCDNCGWTWKIEDGGNDLYICHKCGHDNTPKETNNFFQPLDDEKTDFASSKDDRVKYYEEYYKNLSPSDFKVETQNDKIVISNIFKKNPERNKEFTHALALLTISMMDNGLNIEPLPNVEFIHDDSKNADELLGKTAYYNPNNQTIVLYTYNRHPKDILRSYAHEMIHHMQNLEGRINNIQGDNINEDEYLAELELEAYSKGNMLFRSWENSLKTPINEWVIDTSKYDYTPSLSNKILTQLHELKVNEITLNSDSAVEINGDIFEGEFKIGDIEYEYSIDPMDNPYDSEEFFSISFTERGTRKNIPTGNAKENYIKILSTMYKIILDFIQNQKPEYIGISSLDKSGYWNIYNNLTKTNRIPGYSRKEAGLDFTTKSGDKGKFIVLKRNN
jgi:hypothetical protein